jgi:endonuclease III
MKRLPRVLAALRALYGPPPPPLSDPFALVLWENVAYLADDAKRGEAFSLLRKKTGLEPKRILAAPEGVLREVARAGILAADRATRLREIAAIAVERFGGDLAKALPGTPREASKALREFPSIGEPGAEKILLFSRRFPYLALESNGLRALLRLGYGRESKSYSASYRSAQTAAADELPEDFAARIEAHHLLRRHGQEICRRSVPLCERCPVTRECDYYRRSSDPAPGSPARGGAARGRRGTRTTERSSS